MFSRLSNLFLLFILALCTSATVLPRTGGGGGGGGDNTQCNTGPNQCCNSVQKADSPGVSALAGLLGIVLGPITTLVGVNCTPILSGGTSCTSQPVCCTGNSFSGILVLGCSPVNVHL